MNPKSNKTFINACGADVSAAADFLSQGEVVAIPTETVYGLACNAFDEQAVGEVFRLKNRPFFDPLIVHVASMERVMDVVEELPDVAQKLMDAFWPGPLTLLLPKKSTVPDMVTSGLGTVAVRMPAHDLTLELLSSINFPLAAPSANPFGYVSPTTAEHVMGHFNGHIPYVLDGGACNVGIESTIIGFENGQPCVYRLGGISLESLNRVVSGLQLEILQATRPAAPGMLKSHYAPSTPLTIESKSDFLNGYNGGKAAFISFCDSFELEGVDVFVLSPSGDAAEAARNLFKVMRLIDLAGYERISAERMPDVGLCRAINDRLQRASAPAEHNDQ
ncbi:MAG: L-threonylcarbamoyladenylate synthase [Bacteroidota bacterium]